MNKWRIQPDHWQYLNVRQQKRLFKTGIGLAGKLMLALVVSSLLIEAMFGL